MLDFTTITLFTKRYDIGLYFVMLSNIYTTLAYYIHERVWNKTKWGLKE